MINDNACLFYYHSKILNLFQLPIYFGVKHSLFVHFKILKNAFSFVSTKKLKNLYVSQIMVFFFINVIFLIND